MRKMLVVSTALVAGLMMSVAGFATVEPNLDVFETSEFTIPVDYHIEVLDDVTYIFTDVESKNVTDPDYVGWAETDVVQISFKTNTGDHSVTFETTPYENSDRDAVLPTQFLIDDQLVVEHNEDGSVFSLKPVRVPSLGTTIWDTMLRIERDGWNDPAGTYEATVTITVAAL